jgi:cardiolipin synthase
MLFNIPNLLTWTRILMIPFVVGVFYLPASWMTLAQANVAATVFFILAAITDALDGWLARKLKQTSAFGAFLDPVADKLMVAAALITLLHLGRVHVVVALIIIGREIAISALREWMAKIGAGRSVAVSLVGKLKTAAQMVAIPLLLFDAPLSTPWGELQTANPGSILIVIAAVLTLWSMAYYLRRAWPDIRARSTD